MLTPLAFALVLFALLAPSDLAQLSPAAFTRIPIEGLLVAGLVLVLPSRSRRVAASFVGVGLAVITLMKLVDIGFQETLGRPFHPVYDWSAIKPAIDFMKDSAGSFASVAAVIGAVLLVLGLAVAMVLAVLRLSKVAVGRRSIATRTVAALGVIWVAFAVLGQPVAANSAANEVYDDLRQARADLLDPDVFAQQAANDRFQYTPGAQLLNSLRGKDVLLVFIESYGRVAVQDSDVAPGVDRVLDEGTRTLDAAGFDARSGFLTSSTFGGQSWLAHATMQAGLRIDTQPRYDAVVDSERLTLTGAFGRAGWRTVGVSPSIVKDWPEAKWFGYDKAYVRDNSGYRGPNFSYAKMPDQYTMSAFYRNEIERADRQAGHGGDRPGVEPHPVDAPATHDPVGGCRRRLGLRADAVTGQDEGGGVARPGEGAGGVRRVHPVLAQTLIEYLTNYGDEDTVMVFLGDHQPGPSVSG